MADCLRHRVALPGIAVYREQPAAGINDGSRSRFAIATDTKLCLGRRILCPAVGGHEAGR